MPSPSIFTCFLSVTLAGVLFSSPALAYVGPGLGLTAIGSALALLAAAALAVVGFFWYPLKRLFGGSQENEEIDGDLESETDARD